MSRPTSAEIDALFDRELDPQDRDRVLRAARVNQQASAEIRETSDMLHELRRPIPTPDFTQSVLTEAAINNAFLSRRHRRRVKAIRNGVGVTALMLLAGVALLHRLAPGAFSLQNESTPLTDMADAVNEDFSESLARIEEIASNIPDRSQAEQTPLGKVGSGTAPLRLIVEADLPEASDLTRFADSSIVDNVSMLDGSALALSSQDVLPPLYIFHPLEQPQPFASAMYRPKPGLAPYLPADLDPGFADLGPDPFLFVPNEDYFPHARRMHEPSLLKGLTEYPKIDLKFLAPLNDRPMGTRVDTPE